MLARNSPTCMNNFNLKQLFAPLENIRMTPAEKASGRLKVSAHMHRNPMGSRPSFAYFRPIMAAALAIVLVIGSGGMVAFASQSSLPGQKLYKVKLATEQAKKITLRTSAAKATYELALIDKRFNETNKLISEQKLTASNEAVVIAAIKTHTEDFKTETGDLSTSDPILALSYNTKLSNTLKTGTHILLALSDRQSLSADRSADSVSPNTLVLAAYASAEKISAEKVQLESIVVSDTNIATIKTAETRYTDTIALLTDNNITPASEVIETPVAQPTAAIVAVDTKATGIEAVSAKARIATTVAKKSDVSTKTEEVVSVEKPILKTQSNSNDIQSLANDLKAAYDSKKYGQVIIIADQIEQQLHENQKIKEVEKTYNITIDTDTSIKKDTSSSKTEVKSGTIINTDTLKPIPELPTQTTTSVEIKKSN